MRKFVEFIKNKKKLVLFIGLLILLLIVLFIIAFCRDKKELKENKSLIQDTYIMYIKINPLVKLTVNEISECVISKTGKEKCTYQKNEVISYEYLNEDAKEVYSDLDLSNITVLEALGLIGKYTVDSEIEFKNIEINTNWKFKYTKDEILNEIKKQTKSSIEIFIDIKENENIDEESLLENEGINYYKVTFNSNGGTEINYQTVAENGKVIKPKNPVKDGYTFSYWKLDDKKYDFELEVTKDMNLVAEWEKNAEKTTSSKNEVTKKVEEKTTKKVENTTKVEEIPKKEETTTKFISKINLNDNVKYYTSVDCAEYIYVNPECLDIPIRDLKVKFPNYDKYLDQHYEEMYQECLEYSQDPNECKKDEYESDIVRLNEYSNYYPIAYFDECDDVSAPSSTVNSLRYGIKGATIYSNSGSHFKFEYLRFQDDTYYKYTTQYPSFSKYGLLMNGGCGGGDGTPSYKTLDETTCKKFNLDCDRW